ncbi:hypothetical protein FAM18124_01314 [Lacticaseibacillus paracasei]|nr:hypothetical protein FAM18124_01314 [Lacticaseibacillus paracasei]RND70336.1 hypothetical protein FAM18129_01305 [Lacticaseibacillus paracasei]
MVYSIHQCQQVCTHAYSNFKMEKCKQVFVLFISVNKGLSWSIMSFRLRLHSIRITSVYHDYESFKMEKSYKCSSVLNKCQQGFTPFQSVLTSVYRVYSNFKMEIRVKRLSTPCEYLSIIFFIVYSLKRKLCPSIPL